MTESNSRACVKPLQTADSTTARQTGRPCRVPRESYAGAPGGRANPTRKLRLCARAPHTAAALRRGGVYDTPVSNSNRELAGTVPSPWAIFQAASASGNLRMASPAAGRTLTPPGTSPRTTAQSRPTPVHSIFSIPLQRRHMACSGFLRGPIYQMMIVAV